LEQRYGAVSSLEEPKRIAKRLGELLDDDDFNSGITTDIINEKSTGDLTHEVTLISQYFANCECRMQSLEGKPV